ncbi:MAG: hypothetical protein ABIX28_20815 [Vicinamibacterales bacterium]
MRAAFTRSPWACSARAAAAVLLATTVTACGQMQRQGEGSSYLIVNALDGSAGNDTTFAGVLHSDVLTVVDNVPTVFNDQGRVRMVLAMKDPGGTGSPTKPTTANYVTISQYHVRFIRADGRNTPGVDVPYAFDGGMTMTVGPSEVSGTFNLVRHIAKDEAPLRALASNGVIISTIAEVTFYGHDQTGREVSATANISVDFGNFGDKTS